MEFRNITLFRFSPLVGMDVSVRLPVVVHEHPLRDVGPLEMSTQGFVPPTIHSGEFVGAQVGTQSKILPAAAISLRVARKVAEIAEREGRKVSGRERKRIREDVITDMLPGAPVREARISSYADTIRGWLVIGTASRKAAENVVSQYREALGSFPAVPLAPEEGPRVLMTDWLANGSLPAGLALGDECELRDPASNTGAIVRCRRMELESNEVREHLRNGMQVYRLGLVYDDRLSFVLGEDLTLRKVTLLDDCFPDDEPTEQQAMFTLATLELNRLLAAMAEWFAIPRPGDVA